MRIRISRSCSGVISIYCARIDIAAQIVGIRLVAAVPGCCLQIDRLTTEPGPLWDPGSCQFSAVPWHHSSTGLSNMKVCGLGGGYH